MRYGKKTALVGAAALALIGPMAVQAAERHPVTADDILGLVSLRGLDCSVDGKAAAWIATSNDEKADKQRSRMWLADLPGGAPRALTDPETDAGAPQFSPDGRLIAFTATRGKDEHGQIWVLDRRGGDAERLTQVEGDIAGFRWSPDGKRIVIAMVDPAPKPKGDDPKRPVPIVIEDIQFKQDGAGFLPAGSHSHLWLFDVATRKLTKLTDATGFDQGDMAFSPDGTTIAFVSNHRTDPASPGMQWLETVPVAGGTPKVVTKFGSTYGQSLIWSDDGTRIYHAVGLSERRAGEYSQPQLAETVLASGATRILPATAGLAIGDLVSLGKGRIGGVLAEDRHSRAVIIDPAAGTLRRLGSPVHAVNEACPAADGGSGPIAVIASSDGHPSEVMLAEGDALRPVSAFNTTLAQGIDWSIPQDFSARASDGNEVHGLFFPPPGYHPGTRVPTVLWIHGGPTAQDEHELHPGGDNMIRQFLAARGYGVIAVNYRGSAGRGPDYAATIAADWGNKEVKDLDAAVKWAIDSGIADPDKLLVGGWSYGGILTDFLIAREPRWKAAMSGAGEGNILALFGVDQYIKQYWLEIGPPWQDTARWLRLSEPLLHADRIKTPTMFMGGTADDNVPLVGGQQLYEALKLTGVPTRLIAYPGANHGFRRPSYLRDRMERIADWFSRVPPK